MLQMTICSVFHFYNLVHLSFFMFYLRIFNKSNKTGATSGPGTVSTLPEVTTGF